MLQWYLRRNTKNWIFIDLLQSLGWEMLTIFQWQTWWSTKPFHIGKFIQKTLVHFRGQTCIPQVKGWLQTIYIHDISRHWDNNANWTYSIYIQKASKSNVDKGFICYSRPVAACRCAHRSRGNPRHVIKTTLHSLYVFSVDTGIMCCTFDSCSCLFCHFHLRAEATILYTHTTHSIDAHIRALNYNTPSRKGARPHRHKHKRPPYTHNPPCSGNA